MNKPIVKVKEKEYSVSNISVVLKVNSGSLIHLRLSEKLDGTEHKLSNEEAFKQEFFQDICREAEGSFQWGGTTLKFILVGSNSSESGTFELVGLVVKKDLIEWFNQNNFKDNKQDYLIYQKTKGKNSWDFLEKAIGNKFQKPNQDFVERLKLLFPENGCIWRYKDSNNFHFLNRAIAFASRHLPEVQGWCAFNADKPLRLILFEEKKQDRTIPKLDSTWNAFDLFLPNRYSWNRWLDRSCTLSRDLDIKPGQEIALIEQLVSHGSNEDEQKGLSFQGQNPTRLLFIPGTINIGDKNIFCHTVSYEFKLPAFDTESPSATMKIEVDYPERQIGDNEIVSLRLPGKFKEWHQKKDGETEIKIVASDLKNWGIIDEGNQSLKSGDDAVLSTQILSPTYSDKKYSGIYIKHEKGDEMILDIHPCSIPLVLGSVQKYRKELEQADVTLSGKKLAISVSGHHQSLDKSEAIILDSSEIKLNHGKKIFTQAQQKVDFLSQNVEISSSQVNINSGKTNINSLVNISFPSPKVPIVSQQVLMKTLEGKTKPLQITPNTKIGDIKKEMGYESADVYLVHGGKILGDESTVADYNIERDSNIEVRGRLRGGASGAGETGVSEASTSGASASSSITPEERVKRRKAEQLIKEKETELEQLENRNEQLVEILRKNNLKQNDKKNYLNEIKENEEKNKNIGAQIERLKNNDFDNFSEITASPAEVFKEDPEDFLKNNMIEPLNILPYTSPGAKDYNEELKNSGIKSFTLEEVKKNHYKLKIVNNDDGKYPNKIRAAYFPYKSGQPGEDLENIGHVKLDDSVDFAFTGGMNGCALALTLNDDGSLEAWHFQSPEDFPNALEKFGKSKQLREWYNFEQYHKSDPNPGKSGMGLHEANNFLYKKGNDWNILSQELHYDFDGENHTNHRYSNPQMRKFGSQNDAKKRFDKDLRAVKEKK